MKKILSLGLSLISVLTMAISTTGCAVKDWSKQLFCEHVYDVGEITKESTCTEVGILAKTCTLCGKVEEEEIEKLPHVELYVESKDATCKESGLTDYVKCKVCDTVLVEPSVIPVLGHRVVEDKEVKATCLANGLTKGEHCEVCGEIFVKQETVLASGHSLVVLEGKPATCTQTGLTNGVKCENCNVVFTEQEEIPAMNAHNFVDGECSLCGFLENSILVENERELDLGIYRINTNGNPLTVDIGGTYIKSDGSKIETCGFSVEIPAFGDGSPYTVDLTQNNVSGNVFTINVYDTYVDFIIKDGEGSVQNSLEGLLTFDTDSYFWIMPLGSENLYKISNAL